MIEIYTMNEHGVTLVDTVDYGDWVAWIVSDDDQYVVNDSAYDRSDLVPMVA